jgi:hypothetical protein
LKTTLKQYEKQTDTTQANRYLLTAYYIAFGAHGPRAGTPPGEGMKVFGYTMVGVAVSFVLFSIIRAFAKGSPGTMNKEYQEATNEYLKVCLSPHFLPSFLHPSVWSQHFDIQCYSRGNEQ